MFQNTKIHYSIILYFYIFNLKIHVEGFTNAFANALARLSECLGERLGEYLGELPSSSDAQDIRKGIRKSYYVTIEHDHCHEHRTRIERASNTIKKVCVSFFYYSLFFHYPCKYFY